jgi:hypothetical protein
VVHPLPVLNAHDSRARAAPVKLADGTVAKFIGVQVDVTRKTEGTCSAFADGARCTLRHAVRARSLPLVQLTARPGAAVAQAPASRCL